eukprot:gnl/MRDRNA2_/MRDRNA2_92733_c0_seq1.p1 gnl/MRDRNA2_/MRDRNA2_92733_c0~~gnl/MRDRNA2_/MRDRNA2_92733_c0_seq1.p1  ORF type:complete len:790 (-),score=152.79 gnl/MRDRNA2_/MRDRNA2_92733_c0_seq1:82-2451(-)
MSIYDYKALVDPSITKDYVCFANLKVHPILKKTVEESVCPGSGFSPEYFWFSLDKVVHELMPEVEKALTFRDELQTKIDAFYQERKASGENLSTEEHQSACKKFLEEISYLESNKGPVSVATQFVDPEIATIAAPQLVVPSDNARFVLNAVNARWGSLYDSLYGFDIIPETKVQGSNQTTARSPAGYNPVRGEAVTDFANSLLDEIAPLLTGKWSEVTRLWPRFVGAKQQLELLLKSGESTGLQSPALFVGSTGALGPPDGYKDSSTLKELKAAASAAADKANTVRIGDQGRVFLLHNGLHLILEIDREHPVGKASLSGISDITLESALSAILDMEDSVATVDAHDKSKVYTNIAGVFRGSLKTDMVKDGKAFIRSMNPDIWLRDETGDAKVLPGRSLVLVRNVGHHMFTDAVVTKQGRKIPEGFLDCVVTIASAIQDLKGGGALHNSRTGSIYIVKPKQHGSAEVALTNRLFGRVEEFFGLRRNTVKMGIMDEERRTSVNLQECIRAASERVFFINTGFLDRTGDEIHTCMVAGPVVRKLQMKSQPWIKAYEDSNVDIGLMSGLAPGKGQIGKGMWAKPDSMKAMMEAKVNELQAGASTAWVPSPSAAVIHAVHYHRVDVSARQSQLTMRPKTTVDTILVPPLLDSTPSKEDIAHELKENAQSILGYVVRWIDLGVGCSKVPDLSGAALMEDRATLRISSQLLANWLHHNLITEKDLQDTFKEMAKVVDQQNVRDRAYQAMSLDFTRNVAYQAALQLVLEGTRAPNGYTEYVLSDARRKVKDVLWSRL